MSLFSRFGWWWPGVAAPLVMACVMIGRGRPFPAPAPREALPPAQVLRVQDGERMAAAVGPWWGLELEAAGALLRPLPARPAPIPGPAARKDRAIGLWPAAPPAPGASLPPPGRLAVKGPDQPLRGKGVEARRGGWPPGARPWLRERSGKREP